MASYKSRVKEYFDKSTELQPPYITKQIGGEPHIPLFESTIKYKSKTFKGRGNSIKKAEEEASKLFYSYLAPQPSVSPSIKRSISPIVESNIIEPTIKKSIPVIESVQPTPTQKQVVRIPPKRAISKKRVVAVDVENKQTFIDTYSEFLSDFEVYAFIGSRHCLAEKEFPDFVNKILVDSTRKDAVDTAIQMYMGIWLALEKSDIYYIVTGDHFAGNLEDLAKNPPNDMWRTATVVQVTQLQHIK